MMKEYVNQAYLPTYDGCYVCGQAHPRGLRIRFFAGLLGQVHAQFRPDCTQTSYQGIVHGGVISTLLDELLGWPIALQTGRMSLTGELTVRFVKPMHAGHTYLATAHPGTDQGKYWVGEGHVHDENGETYAKARGKYFLLSTEQTAIVADALTYQPDDVPVFRYNTRLRDREQDTVLAEEFRTPDAASAIHTANHLNVLGKNSRQIELQQEV
ncbi:MAG: PaaI family thioesterase [Chloroflexi bacterium]|nr:PaaI family thioesterase [Chloroflexota bacterium]